MSNIKGQPVNPNEGEANVSKSALSLEQKKKAAYDMAETAYYDANSPHFRDNKRFSWAVKTISEWTIEDN